MMSMHPSIGSGGRVYLASGLVVSALLLWASQPLGAQERWGLSQNSQAGSRVFGSKGCSKCHSVNGLGGTLGPDLAKVAEHRSLYDLAATMWNHLPTMKERMRELGIERPQLNEHEAADLIAFLFTLNYFDPPGDVEAGEHLFEEKKCMVCHKVGVRGGVAGPSLDYLGQYGSPIFVAAAMWNHGPGMQKMMEKKGIRRPIFSGPDLTDLITYIESVSNASPAGPLYVLPGNAADGRDMFVKKGCVECHSIRGAGGGAAPDLARRGVSWDLAEFAAAMWNKAPAMMARMRSRGISVPQLNPGEMADLLAYLYSVRYFAESGNMNAGRHLLRTRGCLTCHSLNARGADKAGDLAERAAMASPAEVVAVLWNHVKYTETGDSLVAAAWPVIGAKEMADIAAFLQAPPDGSF